MEWTGEKGDWLMRKDSLFIKNCIRGSRNPDIHSEIKLLDVIAPQVDLHKGLTNLGKPIDSVESLDVSCCGSDKSEHGRIKELKSLIFKTKSNSVTER